MVRVDRELVERLLAIYTDAETRLQVQVARRLAAGVEAPGWVDAKHAEIGLLRGELQRILTDASLSAQDLLHEAVGNYADAARQVALADLAVLSAPIVTGVGTNTAVVDRLARQLALDLAQAASGATQSAVAGYRAVISETAAKAAVRAVPRRTLLGEAVERFANQGLGGFADSRGRVWRLETYADMAIRSTLHNAYVETRVDTYQANQQNLVIVSDSPHECRSCRPYELTVLSLDGSTPAEGTPGFRFAGSLAAARGNGLLHPGCRHNLGLYVPGLSKAPAGPTADPVGDKARQQLRYHERQVRDAKRRVEVATVVGDSQAMGRSERLLRARTERLQAHLAPGGPAAEAGLRRRSDRERVWLPAEGRTATL